MGSKLEEHRSVVKILLLEGEKTFFKGCKVNVFVKPAYPARPFIAGFHSLGRTVQV